ncbi:MAG: glycine cleavage system protein GcvH [Ignavibacteriales bacterium]|jgi:glycine cleavage system H protein|nr:glycine cleavage system protein GcvH [Ignavibacteriaceae bacterium]NLH60285.1 glycine cleavage system protein GcvH [Ignavibacteriales bacterium]HOJ19173.1 glycine cleavage system protein GcvH [Ignavibacteriaceae bacterium]HPO54692.1 glycine cleavage system protein GcvH [Ignavibacteriaceae bacterium]
MNIPDGLKYTKEHEWVSLEGNVATIGITDYAQGELGDVVFIDIDPNLSEVTQGGNCGTIEAVKTVSEIYAPCSGKVLEINPVLSANPETVNQDPYGTGWMLKIEITNPAELDSLLDTNGYRELIGQ